MLMLTYIHQDSAIYVRSFLTYSLHVLQMTSGSIYSTTSGVICTCNLEDKYRLQDEE